MTDAHAAAVSRKRGINPIWAVPILALLLGIWMVIYTIQRQGPEITIRFSTAEGIEQGKTKIKLRDVEIGLVKEVRLGEDHESVLITASLEKEAEDLLVEDTQFWVVRPRIGKTGVSGLGTLLSGGYIQIAPGESSKSSRAFVGLEEPPVTPAGTPGMRVVLVADKAGSVSPGDPVLYKGYPVGRVETEKFDLDTKTMSYDVFIDAPYDELLTTTHRFWDISGVSIKAGADGVEMDSVALETLLIGGVEVGRPENVEAGSKVESGTVFRLYDSYASVNERPYRYSKEYVLRFPQSVRGLHPGAPVEYRGLHVGEVERIMVTEMTRSRTGTQAIPVLVRLEPARLEQPDSPEGVDNLAGAIERAVGDGLRASLSTGNLLTGSLIVNLDMYPDAKPAELGQFAGRPTLPTVSSGLEGLQQKLNAFLDKLNQLDLEGTVKEAQQTLASLRKMLASEGAQQLPQSLDRTLAELQQTLASLSADSELQGRLLPAITELDRTLQSLRGLLDTLEDQPNALIFNREYGEDPRPPAGSR